MQLPVFNPSCRGNPFCLGKKQKVCRQNVPLASPVGKRPFLAAIGACGHHVITWRAAFHRPSSSVPQAIAHPVESASAPARSPPPLPVQALTGPLAYHSPQTGYARHVLQDEAGRVSLKNFTLPQLESWCTSIGEPTKRAVHLWRWMYADGNWVHRLSDTCGRQNGVNARFVQDTEHLITTDGGLQLQGVARSRDGTRKLLFKLTGGKAKGSTIETVIIPVVRELGQKSRLTLCVSTQVGCAMNCQFCYTGRMGLFGNLTTAQIVEQVVEARRFLSAEGDDTPLTNLVYMGMGEPLHNLQAVMDSINIVCCPLGLHVSHNKITVSTVGLVDEMKRFVPQSRAQLALSLHATTDEVRDWIVPVNRRYPLEKLIEALRELFPVPQSQGQGHLAKKAQLLAATAAAASRQQAEASELTYASSPSPSFAAAARAPPPAAPIPALSTAAASDPESTNSSTATAAAAELGSTNSPSAAAAAIPASEVAAAATDSSVVSRSSSPSTSSSPSPSWPPSAIAVEATLPASADAGVDQKQASSSLGASTREGHKSSLADPASRNGDANASIADNVMNAHSSSSSSSSSNSGITNRLRRKHQRQQQQQERDGAQSPTKATLLIEYIMLRGINDSLEDAHRLAQMMSGVACKINLIEFNPHEGTQFLPSLQRDVAAFKSVLIQAGHVCTVRSSRGDDEMAACGQLGGVDGGAANQKAAALLARQQKQQSQNLQQDQQQQLQQRVQKERGNGVGEVVEMMDGVEPDELRPMRKMPAPPPLLQPPPRFREVLRAQQEELQQLHRQVHA